MNRIAIRLYLHEPDGRLTDSEEAFGLDDFGGQLPVVGDMIVGPGAARRPGETEQDLCTVVGRVFNPRVPGECVALIVEKRSASAQDIDGVTERASAA